MIALQRTRTGSAISTVFLGQKRIDRELELMELVREALRDDEKPGFSSARWKPAKKQLKKETHGKCAYCEASTAVVAHGDVEHFRPKSRYWWLAYCYDNYLYSCQICNQSFKSNHFDSQNPLTSPIDLRANTSDTQLQNAKGTLAPDPKNAASVAQFLASARGETAHLPDPYDPGFDPDRLFEWVEDEVNHEVVLDKNGSGVAARRALEACQNHLGLNREELRRRRFAKYSTMRTFKEALERFGLLVGADDPIVTDIRAQLAAMMSSDSEYAAMARFYVNSKWSLGIPVPQ